MKMDFESDGFKEAMAAEIMKLSPPSVMSSIIGMDVAKPGSDTTAFHFYDGEQLIPVSGSFKLDNNVKPKVPDIKLGKFEITGNLVAQFPDNLYNELYKQQFAAPKQCPPPLRHVPSAPVYGVHVWDPLKAMQIVFDRLLEAMRMQCGPGYEVIPDTYDPIEHVQTYKASALYRTQNGARCPFGYLIPDHAYDPDMERRTATEPRIMEAMGLGQFVHCDRFCKFLADCQRSLHDEIMTHPKFMIMFEEAAERIARQYNLVNPRRFEPPARYV